MSINFDINWGAADWSKMTGVTPGTDPVSVNIADSLDGRSPTYSDPINGVLASQPAPSGGGGSSTSNGDENGNGIPDWYEREQAAANDRRRTSAFSTLLSAFKQFGIDTDGTGLAAELKSWVWSDLSEGEIMLKLRNTRAYNDRFTGMADLIKRGQAISEAEYIALEKGYRDVMTSWNLPNTFYDEYKDFGRFIANGVSVKEVDDRVRSAQTFLDTQAPQTYRDALKNMGISDSALLAHVLDGDRAQSIIQNEMKQAAFAGAANQFGFDINADESAKYATTLGDQFNSIGRDQRSALEQSLSKLGEIAASDERLSYIDSEAFQREDTLDAQLMNDTGKRLASEKRALREKRRFSGTSAVTSGTFARNGGV